ncbi:MAG: FHA domain-containing protein [Pseudobdellovibrio sp.]
MIIEIIKDSETLTYEINKPMLTIGRWHTCDIPINDINISREHLRLIVNANNYQIQDLKSSNGTMLNGNPISNKQMYIVTPKDVITFGNCFVQVRIKKATSNADVTDVQSSKISEMDPVVDANKTKIEKEKTLPLKVEAPAFPEEKSIHAPLVAKVRTDEPVAIEDKIINPIIESDYDSDSKILSNEEKNIIANQSVLADLKNLNPDSILESVEKVKYTKDAAFNFKNVGLDMPKYKNTNEHAQEIIRDAEFLKHSIIKKGEASAAQLIDNAKIKARQESEKIHQECKTLVDQLLLSTKSSLERSRVEAEKVMSDKRLMLSEEIQLKWDEHDELMYKEKLGHIEKIEKEHRLKLELSLEKMKTDMFVERDQLVSIADNEILNKKRKFQLETSQEREIHYAKLKEINAAIDNLKEEKASLIESINKIKIEFDKAELDFITATNNLRQISDKSQEAQTELDKKITEYNELEIKSRDVIELRNTMTQQEASLRSNIEDLSRKYSVIAKKSEDEEARLNTLTEQLETNKKVGKAQIEEEFKKIRDTEDRKYQDFKAIELKSLQKIKDDHVESIKKYSIELSEEIASKLELLAKKNQNQAFDYTKSVELVHSVIQVKSSDSASIDAKHVEQLASWKKRQSVEKFKLLATGFAACFVVFLGFNVIYKALRVDPFEAERKKMALDRKQSEEENRFIPIKSEVWHSNYTELTLNTDQFVEAYLNDQNQERWVTYITKYFLNQWKVSEEKVIAVVSSSKAFVQSIEEQRPDLKKSKIKIELAKMKQDETELIEKNAALFGSQVRYEAYKKKEQEFFQVLTKSRSPAGK